MQRLFRPKAHEETARALYAAVVAQARRPAFFRDCGLPDTLDGRFDLLVLHVFLVLHRLKRERAQTAELSQALFDLLFQNLDESLREMGAGDMGVGRRIKAMAEGFYGRILAYERALAEGEAALGDCVRRNLYGAPDGAPNDASEPSPAQVAAVAGYIGREVAALDEQDLAQLAAGQVVFGPAPELA